MSRDNMPVDSVVRRCEELARPLYAGLDGVQTFDRVERVRQRIEVLEGEGAEIDRELLAIMAVFHGVVARLGSLAAGARLDLFLADHGIDGPRRLVVRRGLRRFATDPRTAEERLLHDAVLLEEAGVPAAVGRLLAAGKKRVPAARAVAALDPGPAAERFATPAGREWARRERRETSRWLADLRRRFADGLGGLR